MVEQAESLCHNAAMLATIDHSKPSSLLSEHHIRFDGKVRGKRQLPDKSSPHPAIAPHVVRGER